MRYIIFALLLTLILPIQSCLAEEPSPRAIDGDTFISKGIYYRLYNIDTPEENELYYQRSREILQDWLDDNKFLHDCKYMGKGKYGRHLAKCPVIEYKLYSLIPNAKWYNK